MVTARVEAEFECAPTSVLVARQFVDAALRVWHLDDLTEVAQLLTSEVVTNAVLHARSAFRVTATWTPPELVVEVWDASSVIPPPTKAALYAERGRGILLVDAFSSGWGCRTARQGKTVWFSLRTP